MGLDDAVRRKIEETATYGEMQRKLRSDRINRISQLITDFIAECRKCDLKPIPVYRGTAVHPIFTKVNYNAHERIGSGWAITLPDEYPRHTVLVDESRQLMERATGDVLRHSRSILGFQYYIGKLPDAPYLLATGPYDCTSPNLLEEGMVAVLAKHRYSRP